MPWKRKWQPTLNFCLENVMDRRAWWAIVHGVKRVGHDLVTKQQWSKGYAEWIDVYVKERGTTPLNFPFGKVAIPIKLIVGIFLIVDAFFSIYLCQGSTCQRKVISIKFEKYPIIYSPQINCKHLVRILKHKVWKMVALEKSNWFISIFIVQQEDRDRELFTLKNVQIWVFCI